MSESNLNRPDVTIIGGGVIGCWSAYYLNECGYVCPSHVMPLCEPGVVRHSLPQLFSRMTC